jgi:hypothetical protein
MKFSLHCCQFLGIAERLLWSEQIGKLCDSNQPVPADEAGDNKFPRSMPAVGCYPPFTGAAWTPPKSGKADL